MILIIKKVCKNVSMSISILAGILRDERAMMAILGLGMAKAEQLGEIVEKLYREQLEKRKGRQRGFGGGRKGKIPSGKEKVCFILFYLKVYPTFDLLSAVSGINRGECCRWVHRLLPLLEKALGRELALPKRSIRSMEEFRAAFPAAAEICLDGMERPRQRPKKKAPTASTTAASARGTPTRP